MKIINGNKAYTYKELYNKANKSLIQEIIDMCNEDGRKPNFDVTKKEYSSYFIGKWLKANGYLRIRKCENYKTKYYYVRVNNMRGNIFKK